MPPGRLYLSYGITRSGSTLAFRLVSELLRHCGQPQRRLPEPLVPATAPFNFSDVLGPEHWQALRPGEALAIKTHAAPSPAAAAALAAGAAVGHVVVRDPRDTALSLLEAGRRDRARGGAFAPMDSLDRVLDELRSQTRSAEAWLALPGMILLRYDEMLADPQAVLRRLAWQLGLRPAAALLRQTAEEVTRRSEPAAAGYARLMGLDEQRRVLDALPRLASLSRAALPHLAPPEAAPPAAGPLARLRGWLAPRRR